jgi:hypothetical protein
MSQASETFAEAILDAENLLQHFNDLNTQPPPPQIEVLKRAGLVMAMTAWETYVEDRVAEACEERLKNLPDSEIASFVSARLGEEIKRLNNPDYAKTLRLFQDFAGIDLHDAWRWNNCDHTAVRERLDHYIKKRGEVVHRSRPLAQLSNGHAVKKGELERAISFLKNLVDATERALDPSRDKCAGSG